MEELKVYEDKMNKTLDVLLSDYGTIRAGRANPHVLDKIIAAAQISKDDCVLEIGPGIGTPPPPSSRGAMFLFRKPA